MMASADGGGGLSETSQQVRRAIDGDRQSANWVVTYFTPLMVAQARYRLSRSLQGKYDPEDLVQEMWLTCLPKLGQIVPREGRYTPVLFKFLSSTILWRYRNLVEKHLVRRKGDAPAAGDADASTPAVDPPAPGDGVVTAVGRRETIELVTDLLATLPSTDREILILKGIEQLPYEVIAQKLGVAAGTLRVRYLRALGRLREVLPASMVDELEAG